MLPQWSKTGSWEVETGFHIIMLCSPTRSTVDQQISYVVLEFMVIFSLERNGILIHATTWMNLENVMLGEISQSGKDKYCMIPLI